LANFIAKKLHFCRFLVFLQGCFVIAMKILVITETDALCGPMAAAFLRDYSPLLEVVSAGRNSLESIDPMVVAVMKECLIDLSGYVPRNMKTLDISDFDAVYDCPEMTCANNIEAYREMRDGIKNEAYLFFRGL
jgi:protein-tyrosine-phosphatase